MVQPIRDIPEDAKPVGFVVPIAATMSIVDYLIAADVLLNL